MPSVQTHRKNDKVRAKIKEEIDIVAYISQDVKLEQQGKARHGQCPFCSNKTSFSVFPETNSFYCFSCAAGGDVITYAMKKNAWDYITALQNLKESGCKKVAKVPDLGLAVLMRDAALYYHNQLKSNPNATKAIEILHAWGIKGKTIVQLGIGFHDSEYHSFIDYMIQGKGYTIEQLESARLVSKTSNGQYCDKMRNSIIIPTIDKNGNVLAFDFYIIDKEQHFKYPNTDAYLRSNQLYSYNLAVKSGKKSVVVVTSYEDYFNLIGNGISNVVSTYLPKITENQLKLLKETFKVIILLTNQHINSPECHVFCRKNNMFCEQLDTNGTESVVAYIQNNLSTINEKIAHYDTLLT